MTVRECGKEYFKRMDDRGARRIVNNLAYRFGTDAFQEALEERFDRPLSYSQALSLYPFRQAFRAHVLSSEA